MEYKQIHNLDNDSVEVISLSEDEIAEKITAKEAEDLMIAKKEQKLAAQSAVLTKLGLTAEEAQALLG
jgi:hypothetical protein